MALFVYDCGKISVILSGGDLRSRLSGTYIVRGHRLLVSFFKTRQKSDTWIYGFLLVAMYINSDIFAEASLAVTCSFKLVVSSGEKTITYTTLVFVQTGSF